MFVFSWLSCFNCGKSFFLSFSFLLLLSVCLSGCLSVCLRVWKTENKNKFNNYESMVVVVGKEEEEEDEEEEENNKKIFIF